MLFHFIRRENKLTKVHWCQRTSLMKLRDERWLLNETDLNWCRLVQTTHFIYGDNSRCVTFCAVCKIKWINSKRQLHYVSCVLYNMLLSSFNSLDRSQHTKNEIGIILFRTVCVRAATHKKNDMRWLTLMGRFLIIFRCCCNIFPSKTGYWQLTFVGMCANDNNNYTINKQKLKMYIKNEIAEFIQLPFVFAPVYNWYIYCQLPFIWHTLNARIKCLRNRFPFRIIAPDF